MSNYPSIEEYTNALQAAKNTIQDTLLAGGTVQLNNWGVPLARNGTFALTYKITAGGRDYAFRCFQRDRSGMHERYTAISASLASNPLPYFVGFEYLTNGITILQRPYPAIRMEWADGEPLGAYIERNVKDSGRLRVLLQQLHGMAFALEGAGVAHGDVQTNNILVAPSGEIKLVDYDGMFVQSISKMGALESGHRNFQHPEREKKSPFDGTLDRFSFALLHCSISALIENPGLWSSIGGDPEALLLRATDFADAYSSKAFGTLTKMPASGPAFLRLQAICAAPYEQIPTFNDFLGGRNIPTERRAAAAAGTSSKVPRSNSGPSVPWYKEATGTANNSNSADAGLGAYAPKGKILDARDSALCLKSDGEQVELIGEVAEVEAEMDAVGHRLFKITLRSDGGPSPEILFWPKVTSALTNAGIMIADDLVGKWVSASGKLSLRWGGRSEAHPGVIVERVKQFEVLNAPQARWRLAQAPSQPSSNRDLLDSLSGASGYSSNSGVSQSSPLAQGGTTSSPGMLQKSPVWRSKGLWALLVAIAIVVTLVIVSVANSSKNSAVSSSAVSTAAPVVEIPTANTEFDATNADPRADVGKCWHVNSTMEFEGESAPLWNVIDCKNVQTSHKAVSVKDNYLDCRELALFYGTENSYQWLCLEKYKAVPIDPASYETCWTSPDIPDLSKDESCNSGLTWSYNRCWNGGKGAELQERISGEWNTVRTDIATKNSNCTSKSPWNISFTRQVTGPGTREYRINLPDTSEGYSAYVSYITAKTLEK